MSAAAGQVRLPGWMRTGLLQDFRGGCLGHFLHITLELCNLNNVPIILRPGMEIGQVTFSMMSSPPEQNYKEIGRYSDNNWNNFTEKKRRGKKAV